MKKIFLLIICCFCLCGCNLLPFEIKRDNGSTVSLNHKIYEKIEKNMSKLSVESLVGTKCNIYYESEEEIWCRFWDKDDSRKKIVLQFVNNKLSWKSQSGLN